MKIGKMDRKITIQRATSTRDELGSVSKTWADIATVWAERRNLKGREHVEALQRTTEAQTLFVIRYSSQVKSVTSADRIVQGGEFFNIVSKPLAIPGGRPEKIEILTKSYE